MSPIIGRRTAIVGMASLVAAGAALARVSPAAAATTHDVEMLNRHPDNPRQRNVFLPLIQTIEPGDTVRWVPTDKGHNSEAIRGMIPDGVDGWKSKINREFSITLEQPGVYGYKCVPHLALGMVGLIIVRGEGMADNLEAAKAVRQRGKAKKVWDEIWAQVEAENLLS